MDPTTGWGMRRMQPLNNGTTTADWAFRGLDPASQTGRWTGPDGAVSPARLGGHGTSVDTYPATQVGKDGVIDPDTGFDAEQD